MPNADRRTHRRINNALAWRDALQYAMDETLGEPYNPNHSRPSIRLLRISESGCDIEIELRFHTGEFYGCCESGDYFSIYDLAWWRRLRAHLADVTDRIPPPLSIAICGVIEEGAKFCVRRDFGLPLESGAFTYYQSRRGERDAGEYPPHA